MSFVALFLPACISLIIRHKRNKTSKWSVPESILEYAVLVMINVLFSQCIVVYILGVHEVDMSALQSFPFFTKYLVISMILAWLAPYVEEIGHKYIKVSFSVEEAEIEERKSVERNGE